MRHLSAGLVASLATAALFASAVPQNASALSISAPQVAPASAAITVADMQAVVSHAYAHLREKPSTNSKILAKLNKGTKVDVIEKVEGGKWAHVKVNNLEGYIATNLLK
ncbi:MAG TPA: SH3 domain-containing protein [Dongiaceae bacterium]